MAVGSTKFKNSLNLEPQSADPSSPSQGDIFYSDGTSRAEGYWQYKAGAWSEFGGAGSGGINYLDGDNSDFENGVGDWAAYADAAATTPADGTGGSPTTTFAQSADTSLRGSNNGLLTKDAANRQGEGAGVAFTIDAADKAKKLTISFDYLTSANYADDDIKVFVYDVTNASLIRINGEDLKANANSATHYAQFQTASDSTSYRLILHISSTNANAYTVRLDNVKVGPTNLAYGTVVTDWESFTPTGTWVSNTTYTGYYRRSGDTADIQILVSTSGAPTAAALNIDLPSGLTIDTNKLLGSTNGQTLIPNSITTIREEGVKQYTSSQVEYTDTNTVQPSWDDGAGGRQQINATSPFTFGANDKVWVSFSVPIAGWSSNAQISEDLGGREIRVRGAGNGGNSITANVTDITFTEVEDTTASWNGSQFTAPESGNYTLNGMCYFTAGFTNPRLDLYVDGTHTYTVGYDTGASVAIIPFYGMVYLEKGQTASIRHINNSTLSNDSRFHWINIQKLASPQTLLETETVAARYTSNSGQTVADVNNVVFEDLDRDTHNAYNTSTGEYTIPVSGWYHVHAQVLTTTTTGVLAFAFYLNGSLLKYGRFDGDENCIPATVIKYFNKGDIIDFLNASGANRTITSNAAYNEFSIVRIK